MEFKIAKKKIADNIDVAMRATGYHKIHHSGANEQLNFTKSLSQAGYPRFHIYLKENKTDYIFSLHLDQKKPIYKGVVAHSGDYDGVVVEEEAQRIVKKIT